MKSRNINNTCENWLTLKEITLYTSLSESTIRRAIQKGELKVSKATGKLLFRRSWVDNFLEE